MDTHAGEFLAANCRKFWNTSGLAFVGSGSAASRLGMNKVDNAKKAWEKAGLPTPAYRVIRRGDAIPEAPGSCVVKAIDSGSSIDVYLCKAAAEHAAQSRDEAIGGEDSGQA